MTNPVSPHRLSEKRGCERACPYVTLPPTVDMESLRYAGSTPFYVHGAIQASMIEFRDSIPWITCLAERSEALQYVKGKRLPQRR